MKAIKCVIVDDEPLALELVQSYVEKVPFLVLVQSFTNAWDLGEFLENNEVGLLILDIEMPGLDSITFLKSLKQIPAVIFITAHRNFAVEAFEVNASDYLLKPVSFDRFLSAINKVKSKLIPVTTPETKTKKVENKSIFVLSERKMTRIDFEEIAYIEARGDYLRFICINKKPILTKMTMKSCIEQLPESSFAQIHRSFIVNKNRVSAYTHDKVQIGEEWLKISRGYKNIFNQ